MDRRHPCRLLGAARMPNGANIWLSRPVNHPHPGPLPKGEGGIHAGARRANEGNSKLAPALDSRKVSAISQGWRRSRETVSYMATVRSLNSDGAATSSPDYLLSVHLDAGGAACYSRNSGYRHDKCQDDSVVCLCVINLPTHLSIILCPQFAAAICDCNLQLHSATATLHP